MADLWRKKGEQFFDNNGDPLNGGKLFYYDAGTTNDRTMYKEAAASTAWTQPVVLDSNGRLTASVYVSGTTDFKEVLKDSTEGTTFFTEDDIPGETVEASAAFARPQTPIITKASAYTITTDDLGKLIEGDATGGDFTLTLPSAVDAGDGKQIYIQNVGSSGHLTVETVGGQTINGSSSISLTAQYAFTIIISDGANWDAFQVNLSATLTSIAALGTTDDRMLYTTGVNTWAETELTTFARTLLDDADADAARTTLGVNSTVGVHTIAVPAVAMTARTTNGPDFFSTELATNDVMQTGYAFDSDTDQALQFYIAMPKSWNEGTITAKFFWTVATGAGNVVWGIRGRSLSNDDAMDASWGTAVTVTDAVISTDDLHISAETAAITLGGTPAEGDMAVIEVYRDADNGSDTHTADAILLAVQILYTTDAENDD